MDQRELLGPALRPAERVAHDPLHAEARIDALFDGDLVRRADPHRAAGTDVRTFGAFAHDDEIDVGLPGERGGGAREETYGTQVHVVIEGEAQLQQQPALEDPARNAGITDRTEQDRVGLAELGQHAVGQRLTGPVPARSPQVVLDGLQLLARAIKHPTQHEKALSNYFRADAVACNYRQFHERRRYRTGLGGAAPWAEIAGAPSARGANHISPG